MQAATSLPSSNPAQHCAFTDSDRRVTVRPGWLSDVGILDRCTGIGARWAGQSNPWRFAGDVHAQR